MRSLLVCGCLAVSLHLLACGSSSTTGAPDGTSGDAATPAEHVDAAADAASSEAADAGSRDGATTPPPRPEDACNAMLDAPTFCQTAVIKTPISGGSAPPDGIYDRVSIDAGFTQPGDSCPPSALRLDRGTYELVFLDLGGPFVWGGSYVLDAAQQSMTFTPACSSKSSAGSGPPEYGYTWDPSTKTLTLFYSKSTPWVYRVR